MTNYERINQRIIEELSKGSVPWKKPWIGTGETYNIISHRSYSVLNTMMLRQSGPYGTVRQWNSINGRISSGEKAEYVYFYKQLDQDKETGNVIQEEKSRKQKYVLRCYPVFHLSQVSGAIIPEYLETIRFDHEPVEEAEEVFHGYIQSQGINFVQEESDKAYYSEAKDEIHVPLLSQYPSSDLGEYYGVLYHEAIHSTAKPERCNRPKVGHSTFGSPDYSREELIAEIGAQYLLHSVGILTEDVRQNSASYLRSWISALQSDSQMITVCAAAAEKSARFILDNSGHSPENSNTVAVVQ